MTYNDIKQAFQQKRNLFITGPGGTGKSWTIDKLCSEFSYIVKTSTTGVSALNIGGQTLHSWGGIGIASGDVQSCINKALAKKSTLNRLKHTVALVVDEVSMLDVEYFVKLRKVVQYIRNNNDVFGGIQMIFVGDFFQIPPVKQFDKYKYIFQTPIWDMFKFKTFKLEKSYRQENNEFFNLLNKIRTGEIDQSVVNKLSTRVTNIELGEKTTLFARRKQVEAFNNKKFSQLPGVTEIFKAKNSSNGDFHKTKYDMAAFMRDCIVPQELRLKKGTKVLLCKNLDKKYVNGSVGIVVDVNINAVWVDFGDGVKTRVKVAPFERLINGVSLVIYQIPLTYGWAITIHKSQGLTLQELHVDISGIFQHSMAYVAFSRVKTFEGLTISNLDPRKLYTDPKVIEFYKTF